MSDTGMTKATERPWSYQKSVPSDGFECFYIFCDGKLVTHFDGPQSEAQTAKVEKIIQAQNAYDDLLARSALLDQAVKENEALRKALKDLISAYDSGNVELNSPEVGGHDDIPPHPWHEEWLHNARALATPSQAKE